MEEQVRLSSISLPVELRCSRRRARARSHPLDSISPALLSPHSRASGGVSRQVRRRSQVGLSARPAAFSRDLARLAHPKFFAAWLRPLFRTLALPQVWRTHGGHRTTYRSSNPTPFSTSVAHNSGMKRLAHNSKTLHGSPRSAPVRPAPDLILTFAPYPTVFHHRFSFPRSQQAPPPLPCRLQLQHLFLAPFNLHKDRVRRTSGFLLTAFSNARPILCSAPHRSVRARLRKSTSVTRNQSRENRRSPLAKVTSLCSLDLESRPCAVLV